MPYSSLEVVADHHVLAGEVLLFNADNNTVAHQPAVYLSAQSGLTFTNDGVIRLTVTGNLFGDLTLVRVGLSSFWTNSVIVNNGTLEGLSQVGGLNGIYTTDWAPSFVNTGTFRVVANGLARGFSVGQMYGARPNYVVNTGAIVVEGSAGALGIAGAGAVTNTGSISVVGVPGSALGVAFSTDGAELINTGSIEVSDASSELWAMAVNWTALGANFLFNSGVIRGDYAIRVSDLADLTRPGGTSIIHNTGELAGRVDLGQSSDLLVNRNLVTGDIRLAGGNDTYEGSSGRVTGFVDGGNGNDLLVGGALTDDLRGGAGDDRLAGGGGDDVLAGGEGRDTFVFGTGGGTDIITDFAVLEDRLDLSALGGVVSAVQQGADTLVTFQGGGAVLLRGVSAGQLSAQNYILTPAAEVIPVTPVLPAPELITGTAGADEIRAAGPDKIIEGGAGDDWIVTRGGFNVVRPGAGNDHVDGLSGYTTVDYSDATGGVAINLQGIDLIAAVPQWTGGSGEDFLAGVYSVIGSDFSDYLVGAQVARGGAGDDVLQAMQMSGGTGSDTFQVRAGVGRVYVNDFGFGGSERIEVRGYTAYQSIQQSGADTIVRFSATDVLVLRNTSASSLSAASFIWHDVAPTTVAINGGTGADTLTGGIAAERLIGNGGNDYLRGGGGRDDYVGGSGLDWADLSDDPSGLTVDLSITDWQATGVGLKRFVGVEALVGSNFNDVLTGNAGANILHGGAGGRDTLVGGAGNDTLYGQGQDILEGGDGNDIIVSAGPSDYTNGYATGGEGNDVMVAESGVAYFQGEGGDDVLYFLTSAGGYAEGGAGRDTIVIGPGPAVGPITIDLTSGELAIPDSEFWLGWSDDIETLFATGTNFADTLKGGAGDDRLTGAGGDDQLWGGAGSDLFAITPGGGADTIHDFNVTQDRIDIRLSGAYASKVQQGADTLVTFGDGTSVLLKNVAAGSLTATNFVSATAVAAAPTMLYLAPPPGVPASGVRTSLIHATLPEVAYDIVRNGSDSGDLRTGDAGRDLIRGHGGADLLEGLGGEDRLEGGLGDDWLVGGAGDDILIGGKGDDRLTGGEGSDIFVIDRWTGRDVIVDFQLGVDRIDLTAFEDGILTIEQYGKDVLVRLYGGSELLVRNVTVDQLSSENFIGLYLPSSGLRIDGDATANTLTGGGGADRLTGNAGNDTLTGGGGADVFVATVGGGADTITDFSTAGDRIDVSAFGGYLSAVQSGADTIITVAAGVTFTLLNVTAGALTASNFIAGSAPGEPPPAGYNLVNGTAAGETLSGGSASDQIYGLGGADTLNGLASADWLDGGAGDDILNGGAGADHMIGGTGNDLFIVSEAADEAVEDIGAGTDRVETALAAWTLGANIENLTGTSGSSQSLTGNDLNNVIVGGASGDTLDGGDGNDTLNGGGGADVMTGGAGGDLFIVDNVGDQTIEAAGGPDFDRVETALASWTLAANIERLFGVSDSGQTLTGNTLSNMIVGGGGADTLNGGEGDDVLTGGAGADTLNGGEGADELTGGLGADVLNGGAGHDIYFVDDVGDVVNEAANAGFDGVFTTLASYSLTDAVENLQGALDTGQTLIGNNLANTITGGGGADRIVGGGGADRLIGGAGADLYVVTIGGGEDEIVGFQAGVDIIDASAFGAYQSIVQAGSDTVVTFAAGVSMRLLGVGVATVTASSFLLAAPTTTNGTAGADFLNGAAGQDTINGLAGNDVIDGGDAGDFLDGGADNDILTGGRGDDLLTGGSGADVFVASVAGGSDTITDFTVGVDRIDITDFGRATVQASGADTVLVLSSPFGDTTFVLRNVAIASITSASFIGYDPVYNVITGTEAANATAGTPGADKIRGLGGDDTLGGFDDNDLLYGGDGADTLNGGRGNDLMDGGAGADAMTGGAGDDTFIIDNVGDTVIESTGGGVDAVLTGLSTYTLANEVENLTGTSAAGQTLVGNGLNNVIIGGGGADTLNGGAGADAMTGGGGDDAYVVDNAGDTTVEAAGGGTDTVNVSLASYTLAAEIENLTGTLASGQVLVGNGLANRITGGAGADTITGGAGGDTLRGNGGADVFVATMGGGADTIADFVVGIDKIDVTAFGGYQSVVQDGADALVTVSPGVTFRLLGVVASTVTAASFTGVPTGPGIINGTSASNTINGGAGADTINGLGGNDTLSGGGGDDVLDGGVGADKLYGDDGADTLIGGDAVDILDGGAGADHMTGGLGGDTYFVDNVGDVVVEGADTSKDTVQTSLAAYTLGANVENLVGAVGTGQALTGNGLANTITGGAGADILSGLDGADIVNGGDGGDVIHGGADIDKLYGEGGDDVLNGGDANDILSGGDGADTLRGDAGGDNLTGGAGADIFVVSLGGGADVVTDFAVGTDRIDLTAYGSYVAIAQSGADTLITFATGVTLKLLGVTASTVTNASFIGLPTGGGYTTINGTALGETLTGTGLADHISGLEGVDTVKAGAGDDWIEGGADGDKLFGEAGNDLIDGGLGNDNLQGGDGNDRIIGGAGNDTIIGGAGADVAVISVGGGADVFSDFVVGEDKIDLTAYGAYTAIEQKSLDTLITFATGVTIRLKNITASTVTNASFIGLSGPMPAASSKAEAMSGKTFSGLVGAGGDQAVRLDGLEVVDSPGRGLSRAWDHIEPSRDAFQQDWLL